MNDYKIGDWCIVIAPYKWCDRFRNRVAKVIKSEVYVALRFDDGDYALFTIHEISPAKNHIVHSILSDL